LARHVRCLGVLIGVIGAHGCHGGLEPSPLDVYNPVNSINLTFLLLLKLDERLHDHFLMVEGMRRGRPLLIRLERVACHVHHLLLDLLLHALEGLSVGDLEVQVSHVLRGHVGHT